MDRYGQVPNDPRNAIAASMMGSPQGVGAMPQAGAFGATPPMPTQQPMTTPQLAGSQPTPPPMGQAPLGGIGAMNTPPPQPTPSFFGNNSNFAGLKPQQPFGPY